MAELDPYALGRKLKELYLRYLDSAYPFLDAELGKERRLLLEEEAAVVRAPIIETLLGYETCGQLAAACGTLGLSADLAAFAREGLFPEDRAVYAHQLEAVRAAVLERRHVVVATGTGSGKTEALFLPIVHR